VRTAVTGEGTGLEGMLKAMTHMRRIDDGNRR
jgi:hypothetical protein